MKTIIIYKVESKKNNNIKYIGATSGPIEKIINYHKYTYKRYIEKDEYLLIKNYPFFRVYKHGDIEVCTLEYITHDDYDNNRIEIEHKYKLKYNSIEIK